MKVPINLVAAALCALSAGVFAQNHTGTHEPLSASAAPTDAPEHKGKAEHLSRKDLPCAQWEHAHTQAAEKALAAPRETASVMHRPDFATGPSTNDNVE